MTVLGFPRPKPSSAPHLVAVLLLAAVASACGPVAPTGPAGDPGPSSGSLTSSPAAVPAAVPASAPVAAPTSAPVAAPTSVPTTVPTAASTSATVPSATPVRTSSSTVPASAGRPATNCAQPSPAPSPPPAITPAPGASPPAIALRDVATGLSAPVGITNARDGSGRLFVLEQAGLIRILDRSRALLDAPFMDARDRMSAGGERGLLGLSFHPDFGCNGRFFVDYTDLNGDTVVAEYRASGTDPDRAGPVPVAELLHIAQPFPNHNGGGLVIGPDGFLYVGMGDGGSANDPQGNGQRLDTLLGKLLRIDIDHAAVGAAYGIPVGNCAGCPAGSLPEIFAYGLRNPWRFSFDRATGDLWIADVGQDRYEEVDHVSSASSSGANFGWSRMEAAHCLYGRSCDQVGLTLPVAEYPHANGDCSITGGYVYRGAAIPALAGWYVFADYCSGRIRAVSAAGDSAPVVILVGGGNIAAFGEDEAGELYVVDPGRGVVSQIVAAP